MNSRQTRIGNCPRCGTAIQAEEILIEYERSDGMAVYAECPECRGVVRPN